MIDWLYGNVIGRRLRSEHMWLVNVANAYS